MPLSKTQSKVNSLLDLRNPCKKVLFYTKADHHSLYQPFVTLVLQHFLKMAKESLEANTFPESILSDANGSKVVKSLLCIQADFVEFYCD